MLGSWESTKGNPVGFGGGVSILQKGRGWAVADVDRGGGAVSAEATAAWGEGACGGVGGAEDCGTTARVSG